MMFLKYGLHIQATLNRVWLRLVRVRKRGRDTYSTVNNVDERFGTRASNSLIWRACAFLRLNRDANDERFVKWVVDSGKLDRELASALFPDLYPPEKRPEYAVLVRDSEHLAKKIFAHYGVAGLEKFRQFYSGSFKPLLDTGVLSKEDDAKISLHKIQKFSFSKSAAFSRRYKVYFFYGRSSAIDVDINHLGEVVKQAGETDKSSDIKADVKLMWSVDKEGRSPQEAIKAASRVFNTVNLEGMQRGEVVELIGDYTHRPKGIYNGPFWPVEEGESDYRFDTGYYGWQFNLKYDEKGICKKVTRKWIH